MSEAADKLVLDQMQGLADAMIEEMDRNVRALRTALDTVRRQPTNAKRDFMTNSLERTIHAADQFRASLGPCRRMMGSYHNA